MFTAKSNPVMVDDLAKYGRDYDDCNALYFDQLPPTVAPLVKLCSNNLLRSCYGIKSPLVDVHFSVSELFAPLYFSDIPY